MDTGKIKLDDEVFGIDGMVTDAMADTVSYSYERLRDPIKVLFVFSVAKTDGGAARVWLNLVKGLPRYNVEPYVVLPTGGDGTMVAALEELGVPYLELFYTWWVTADPHPHSFTRRIARMGAQAANARTEAQVERNIEEAGIDLVYICDGTIPIGLEAAKRAGVPVVWHFHQFVRGSRDGLSFIEADEDVAYSLKQAARIITVTKGQRDDLAERFGLDRGKMEYVYNGVEAARLASKVSLLDDESLVVFTLAGRVDANKRQLDAVDAFDKVADAHHDASLLLVGSGSAEDVARLQQRIARSAHANRIEYLGFEEDMWTIWGATDVALNCSMSEGCSMVVAEGMASGCLVLASTAEGNAELLDPQSDAPGMYEGIRGLLYERGNVDDLANQMAWILEHRVAAREIAAFGRADARQAFSLDRQLKRIRAVFDDALGKQ